MFEDLTLKAMYEMRGDQLPSEFINISGEQSCWDHNSQLAHSLIEHQPLFLPVEYMITTPEQSRQLVPHLYLNEQQIDTELEFIESKKLSLQHRETKTQVSLCKFLSIPQMSGYGSFYSRGPRPRVKGGWGGSSSKEARLELTNILKDKKVLDSKEKIIKETPLPQETVSTFRSQIEEDFKKYLEAANE